MQLGDVTHPRFRGKPKSTADNSLSGDVVKSAIDSSVTVSNVDSSEPLQFSSVVGKTVEEAPPTIEGKSFNN